MCINSIHFVPVASSPAWRVLATGKNPIPLESRMSVWTWRIKRYNLISCQQRHRLLHHFSVSFRSHIPAIMNARAMYPHFIPIHENLLLQVSWALRGLYDSFRVDTLFSAIVRCVVIDVVERHTHWLPVSDAEIRANLFKSVLLNSLSVTSIYIYDVFLHPLVNDQEKWLHRNVGRFYQAFWLLPVVSISFYLNVCPTSVLIPGNYVCWTRVYFNPS